MEETSLHMVIVGHVDHGKSTLVGRLLFDTGSLPPEKLAEVQRASQSQGKGFEFAYVMDNLEEERAKGITIDIAHTFFVTKKRRYVIIDAPGHKEFLKNMISGTSQAQAALLLIDVSLGVQEQTLRHCYILGMLGVKQVAVIVNKMDLVGYSQERFDAVKKAIEDVLSGLKVEPAYIIPISASRGENVAKRSAEMPWYTGPVVLEALDSFTPLVIEEKGLRFPVQDIYYVDGQSVAVGRVEAGILRNGQAVVILPENRAAKIVGIKKYLEEAMSEASAGDCIGITIEGGPLKRGQVIADMASTLITDTIHANIFWMVDKEYRLGVPVTFKCATQEVRGKIIKINKRFDPASVTIVENDAQIIKPAEIAEVEIALEAQVSVDRFSDIPELGRFVLEHAGHPVAGGIII